MKRFNKVNKKKKVIIGFLVVILIGLVLIQSSYAFFQRENEIRFISAKVGDFRVSLSNITATSTSNSINLTYTAGGYNASTTCAFGTTKGNYNLASSTVNNNNCTKTGLSQNTKYYYKVCTKNKLNQESCKEGSINTKYNAPTLSDIMVTKSRVAIYLKYTESGTVSNRTCKYGISDGSYTTNAASQTSTECSIKGLKTGTTYYYQICLLNDDASVCQEGEVRTLGLSDEKNLLGKYVRMTPTKTSYTISKDLTGYSSDQTIDPSKLSHWRVLSIEDDGSVELISDSVSPEKISFVGKTGYYNYVAALNKLASQYTDGENVVGSRSFGWGGRGEYVANSSWVDTATAPWPKSTTNRYSWESEAGYLSGNWELSGAGDIGFISDYNKFKEARLSFKVKNCELSTRGCVWIASRHYEYSSESSWWFGGRVASYRGDLDAVELWRGYLNGETNGVPQSMLGSFHFWPVIKLKPSVDYQGTGSSSNPYTLKVVDA